MTKYEVSLRKVRHYTTTITVDATDREHAEDVAMEVVDPSHPDAQAYDGWGDGEDMEVTCDSVNYARAGGKRYRVTVAWPASLREAYYVTASNAHDASIIVKRHIDEDILYSLGEYEEVGTAVTSAEASIDDVTEVTR